MISFTHHLFWLHTVDASDTVESKEVKQVLSSPRSTLAGILSYICSNAPVIMTHASWLSLSPIALATILASDSLAASEIDVYHAAVRWAEARSEVKGDITTAAPQRRGALAAAFHCIRFPLMVYPMMIIVPPILDGILMLVPAMYRISKLYLVTSQVVPC